MVLRDGAPGRVRNCDAQLFKLPLYRLSYGGRIWSSGPDSNRRKTDLQSAAWPLCHPNELAAPAGLEPAITWIRTRRLCRLATGLRFGAPNRIRTCDLLVENQTSLAARRPERAMWCRR